MPLYIKNADSEVNLEVFKVFFFTVKTQSRSILQTEYSVYTCIHVHASYMDDTHFIADYLKVCLMY